MDTRDGNDLATMEVDGDTVAMETNRTVEGMTEDGVECGGEMEGAVSAQQELCQVWNLSDGVCSKRVVQKGQGVVSPVMGAVCGIILQIQDPGPSFNTTMLGYSLGESSMQLGEGDTSLSHLIDRVLMSMKRGEMSEVSMRPMRAIGDTKLLVTLLDFSAVVPFWRMTPVEKRTTATHHKERGAQLFKFGRVEAAFARFSLATCLLVSIPPQDLVEEDDSTTEAHQVLLCQCYLNLAACQMKTGHNHHVITNCSYALELDPTNVKARYRRASAYMGLGDYDSAKCDLEKGLSKEPGNKVFLELLQTVNAQLAQSDSRMAQGLSKMFSSHEVQR